MKSKAIYKNLSIWNWKHTYDRNRATTVNKGLFDIIFTVSILVQNFENGQKIKTGNETKKRSFLIGKKIV
jgi:hypothetical protein